ncbi:calreticulin isoform X1 [Tanacetum coccineum]
MDGKASRLNLTGRKMHENMVGEWNYTYSQWNGDANDKDYRFYAIFAEYPEFSNKDKTLVFQISVMHEQKLDCNGGYMKLLSGDIDQTKFGDDTPYSSMFGPDICGYATKKFHAILTYNGENKLIKKDVPCETGQLSHVYTFIRRLDATYTILIDNIKDPQSMACFFKYTAGLDKSLVGDFLEAEEDIRSQSDEEFNWYFMFAVRFIIYLYVLSKIFDYLKKRTPKLLVVKRPGRKNPNMRKLRKLKYFFWKRLQGARAKKKEDVDPITHAFDQMKRVKNPPICLKDFASVELTREEINKVVAFLQNPRAFQDMGAHAPRGVLIVGERGIGKTALALAIAAEAKVPVVEYDLMFMVKRITEQYEFILITLLMHKSKKTAPFIVSDSRSHLDRDMFVVMSGPTIAAILMVFDHAELEDVFQTCIDGFLAVAKISACRHLEYVLDDLVVSLCHHLEDVLDHLENCLHSYDNIIEMADGWSSRYGDFIRASWRNILDCILKLHKLGLLPARVFSDAADDSELSSKPVWFQ